MTYGLDSAHYFTYSHLSGDAFFKICLADNELLIDYTDVELVWNMIRGCVSSVFDKRLFNANNGYLDDHKSSEYDTYSVSLGANNLHGRVLVKLPLPLNSFETIQNFK